MSTANLPQLAVDVLVSSLKLKRIASLRSDLVLSICGPDPFAAADSDASDVMALSLERMCGARLLCRLPKCWN